MELAHCEPTLVQRIHLEIAQQFVHVHRFFEGTPTALQHLKYVHVPSLRLRQFRVHDEHPVLALFSVFDDQAQTPFTLRSPLQTRVLGSIHVRQKPREVLQIPLALHPSAREMLSHKFVLEAHLELASEKPRSTHMQEFIVGHRCHSLQRTPRVRWVVQVQRAKLFELQYLGRQDRRPLMLRAGGRG